MPTDAESLPEGWASCFIGEIAEVVGGGTPKTAIASNFTESGGVPWITPADLRGFRKIYIDGGKRQLSGKGLKSSSARILPKGTVLFSSRAPIGYVAIAANELSTNQGFRSFICSKGIIPEYVFYYLKYAKPIAEALASGTTFLEISGSNASKIPILVPPRNEQHRIVAKLEQLLSKVDECKERLERIPAILKRFRQSVLAAAHSGQLTKDWTKQNAIQQNAKPVELRNVVNSIQIGPFGSLLHKSDYIDNGIPVVNPTNIKDGRIQPSSKVTIKESKKRELPGYVLQEGDVVVARRGEMGRCAVVRKDQDGWMCGTGSLFIRPGKKMVADYLQIAISSPITVAYLENSSVGTTMTNLNQHIFEVMEIDLPEIAEQKEIVRRVQALFGIADQIEARYKNAKAQVDRLTQSILAKAFRGELVPQDPNDEPASELLKRVKEERVKRAAKGKAQ